MARKQVEDGAMVLDVNMDDALIDGKAAMTKFLRIAVTEPDVAKVRACLSACLPARACMRLRRRCARRALSHAAPCARCAAGPVHDRLLQV